MKLITFKYGNPYSPLEACVAEGSEAHIMIESYMAANKKDSNNKFPNVLTAWQIEQLK